MGEQRELTGSQGRISYLYWDVPQPRYLAVIAHGYGEHMGRYEALAQHLGADGGAVIGPDHLGHGNSDGERALIDDFNHVLADLDAVIDIITTAHPDLPVVLIGHSMGGLIGTRYAQLHGERLRALVLSGPVLGSWHSATELLDLPEIPEAPLDPSTLSRDPSVGREYQRDELVYHGKFRAPTLEALKRTLADVSAGGNLGALPTLWLHGQDDELVPMAESTVGVEQIAGAELQRASYPGAKHEIFNETNADEVRQQTTDFIHEALKL